MQAKTKRRITDLHELTTTGVKSQQLPLDSRDRLTRIMRGTPTLLSRPPTRNTRVMQAMEIAHGAGVRDRESHRRPAR